jgi:virulence factor
MSTTKLRIAHIGLGDIARKAYLPLTTTHPGITPMLCTRNERVLEELAQQYRIKDTFNNLDALIASRPDGAMIHSSTDSHPSIAKKLLGAGIPVFVDKPVSDSLAKTEELFALARTQDVALFVGFNRRYAPLISRLRKGPKPNHIRWQKDRLNQPGEPRTFIFDDFIHVVDSLLFWTKESPKNLQVHAQMEGKNLASVQAQWTANGTLFSGSMNRLSGCTEERVELFAPGLKVQIEDLHNGVEYKDGQRKKLGFGNWEPTLYKRGFVTMIDEWLEVVRQNEHSVNASMWDLRTHGMCEEILGRVTQVYASRNHGLIDFSN